MNVSSKQPRVFQRRRGHLHIFVFVMIGAYLIHSSYFFLSSYPLHEQESVKDAEDQFFVRKKNGISIHEKEPIIIQDLNEETQHLTNNGLWEYLQCEEIFASERPIHSIETWNHARQVYREIVGNDQSSIGTNQDDIKDIDGFQVAHEAKQAPPKGRGIFAAQDIPKGQLIWSTKKTIRFSDGDSYRKFNLSVERGFACDVLQWSYVQRLENGELRVSTDLDDGALCNGGGSSHKANMGCDKEMAKKFKGGCVENYFALSDIKAGDELLCAYGSFAIAGGWKEFTL